MPDRAIEETLVPVFRVANSEAAVGWYRRLGFVVDYEHASGPSFGRVQVVLRRGQHNLILSNREEDEPGDGLIYMRVPDVESIAAEFNVELKSSPVAAHIELCDLDGNRIRIVTARLGGDKLVIKPVGPPAR